MLLCSFHKMTTRDKENQALSLLHFHDRILFRVLIISFIISDVDTQLRCFLRGNAAIRLYDMMIYVSVASFFVTRKGQSYFSTIRRLKASGVATGWHGWTMSRGPGVKGALERERHKKKEIEK